ncbi:hypothetical protein PSP6_540003 [Paraburkholderia tropica]|uniref:hypothetical protein n=1 Tax=Paraburkholderia tropica TaxID=92647 RepID=UPI001CB3DEBA|nr:hypothetical protein [Paraburkholderia tropica]CAG9229853.1 hypothetical protein PSP6_540003 [Paraburkholderia tropica]
MIFELKIFFQRPVSTPNGLVMFSKEHVEAPTLADAQQTVRAKWEARRAVFDYFAPTPTL